MSIWETREQAITATESILLIESEVIYQGFSLLDEMLVVFQSEDTAFYRITGLTLVKARNIAQGLFSLSLDGLAQESGALLRPLIECVELLTYLRENPQRVDEVLEERLPSAGEIAKRIQGKLQKLRSYLNQHASHFSFAPESLSHLIDFKSGSWRTIQHFNESVLRKNVTTLFAFQVQLLFEAANCLASNELLTDSLEDRLNEFKEEGYKIFTGAPNEDGRNKDRGQG
jgi:hypothetical protein